MLRRFFLVFLCISVFYSANGAGIARAQVMPAFGELATYTIPCEVPPAFLTYALPIGVSPESYMFLVPGTIFWPFYVPYKPASFGLGLYVPVEIPCGIYVGVAVVIVGYGVFSFWGASSL